MVDKIIPKSCGTHDGTFHADEVTACALLIVFGLIDRDKIYRTRDPAKLSQCEYVCDVGGTYDSSQKLFDHHQVEYQGSLSSAGMILSYLKEANILNEQVYYYFNNNLISGVDDHDNGLDPQIPGICTYSHVMANFTPIHYDSKPEDQDAAFYRALDFAMGHLQRMWDRYQYVHSCREDVALAMEPRDECLMFDRALPWMDLFFELEGINHPAQFVIMPTGIHWKLRGIPPTYDDRMEVRLPLPMEWAGHLEEDLKDISGIEGAIFCHKGRFISVWETKKDALLALEYTLQNAKKELQ
jgi:uncharacterized UPF0160 family protein